MERDDLNLQIDDQTGISTHTLTWSVTCVSHTSVPSTSISTHTLTWSVTQGEYIIDWIVTISTHTLTWSVTPAPAQILCRQLHFNSHAHVERDILA